MAQRERGKGGQGEVESRIREEGYVSERNRKTRIASEEWGRHMHGESRKEKTHRREWKEGRKLEEREENGEEEIIQKHTES